MLLFFSGAQHLKMKNRRVVQSVFKKKLKPWSLPLHHMLSIPLSIIFIVLCSCKKTPDLPLVTVQIVTDLP